MTTATLIEASEEQYHSLPQVSRSQLSDFMTSPALYYRRHVLKEPLSQLKPTDAMDFGTACHQAILVDRDATKGFVIIPESVLTTDGKKFGKKWDQWKLENSGVHHLKAKEAESWLAMWESLKSSEPASKLLFADYKGSHEEKTALWNYEGIELRCRLDRVIPGIGIADLKTCAKADLNSVERELVSRKLDIQAAFYRRAWASISAEILPFTFVFLEKVAPYRTVCVSLDDAWLEHAEAKMLAALDRMQKCADVDDWEDPLSATVQTLTRPRWADNYFDIGE